MSGTYLVTLSRKTRETTVDVGLSLPEGVTQDAVSVETGVPFFDHMLHALAFHGGFPMSVRASGDTDVDAHHTVEDVGIVLGRALHEAGAKREALARFGHCVLPMDDALSEATVDFGGRAVCVYRATYPQPTVGTFDTALVREFFIALASNAAATMHLECRYGENSHHMVEALFKATGRALSQAFAPAGGIVSTKGALD